MRSKSLTLLLLALVVAIVTITSHYFLAPSSVDRFLASRDRADALLHQPVPERFIPTSPSQPILVQHRELAEQVVMRSTLRLIMWSEATYPRSDGMSPYRVIYGGHLYEGNFDKHPDICVEVASGKITPQACHGVLGSTAAGACQFITSTWKDLVDKYRDRLFTKDPVTGEAIGEFHPLNQELMCMMLFAQTGAYDPLMESTSVTPEGKIAMNKEFFTQAIHLAASEWASFPLEDGSSIGSSSGQKAHDIDTLWQQFLEILEQEEGALFPTAASLPEKQFGNWLSTLVAGDTVADYIITSPFGMRMHPIFHVMRMHKGIDAALPTGTPIVAPVAGNNTCTEDGKWGVYAWFEPDDLADRAFLAHHTSACEEGHYNPGEVFANSGDGSIGNGKPCCAPHLHFETWRSVAGSQEPYDPPKGWVWAFIKGSVPEEDVLSG